MYLFLLVSLPFYLYLIVYVNRASSKARLVSVIRYCSFGIFAYIPVYLLGCVIPDLDFFPWDIYQVFWSQLLSSREAYFRIASAGILLFIILQRYRKSPDTADDRIRIRRSGRKFQWVAARSDELFCWLTGYFLAGNFHDFFLLGPLPTTESLFFQPLSRILFAQFTVFAFEFLQLVRHPQAAIRGRACGGAILYFLFAFVVLSISSSVAIILNAYWSVSLILLITLLLYFLCVHPFDAISCKGRSRFTR